MSRPFGVALLMAGVDEKGPQLFFSDPSGTYTQYKAKAIGAGSEGAQATLQEKFRDDMTLIEAENLVCEILKQVMEEKINNENIEVASITTQVCFCRLNYKCILTVDSPILYPIYKSQGYHLYSAAELDVLIRRVQ